MAEPVETAGTNMATTCKTSGFDTQKLPHLTQMATLLNSFRANDSLCDVTIKVHDQEYRAHKNILASTSAFFRAMFTTGYSEASKTEVVLEETPDLDAERFAILLDFMYTGEITLSLDSVPEILSSASYLQITHAIQACADYLNKAFEEDRLTLELCLKLTSITSFREIDHVTSAANRYLASKFSDFLNGESFLKHVTYQGMSNLLERNDLQVTDESEVLDALIAWLKYDWDNRKAYTINLLGRIRLGIIPLDKITDAFENQLAVLENQMTDCLTLYMDIMKFYSLGKKTFTSKVLVDKKDLIFTPRVESEKTLVAIGKQSYCFKEDGDGLSETKQMPYSKESTPGQAIAVANGQLYKAGGGQLAYDTTWHYIWNSRPFEMYIKKDNKWVNLKQMNYENRTCFGFIHLDGYLYAIGGTKGDGKTTDTVERYNISADKWQKLSRLPFVVKANTVPSVGIFHHYLLVAGYNVFPNDGHRHLVMMFNTKKNTWHTLYRSAYLTSNNVYQDVHVYTSDETVYIIVFHTVTSKHTASSNWTTCPTVYKCCLGVQRSNPTFTIGEMISQKCIPETNMRVFRIGNEVCIIVRGYVYKTRVKIADDQVYDADLSSYSSLERVDNINYAVTSYEVERKLIITT